MTTYEIKVQQFCVENSNLWKSVETELPTD